MSRDPSDTPMFQQFRELKAAHPDAILLFRMGDFYETFFEDAVIAAKELDLTLTSRNKGDDSPIPMAGVPHHAIAPYVQKLVEAGHKVAIAEQMEDPALAKGIVRRAIVRVVSPGVAYDPTAVDAREGSYLVGIASGDNGVGLAFLDVTTGDLRVTRVSDGDAAAAEVHRMEPLEALIAPDLDLPAVRDSLRRRKAVISRIDAGAWSKDAAVRELCEVLAVDDLAAFGVSPNAPEVRAAGAVVRYARENTGGKLRNLHRIRPYAAGAFMIVDETTRRNLEIVRSVLGGHKKGSLLHLIDRAATGMGSRLLREWLAFPLLDPEAIDHRQAAVAALVDESSAREDLRSALGEVADIERIGARVSQGIATPRDLALLRRSLAAVPRAIHPVRSLVPFAAFLPKDRCEDALADLSTWLVDEPPIAIADGGVIRRGANAELDELVTLSADGLAMIRALEERERAATGIASLKLKSQRACSGASSRSQRRQTHKVPARYIRRQTLSTGERYMTPELKEIEEQPDHRVRAARRPRERAVSGPPRADRRRIAAPARPRPAPRRVRRPRRPRRRRRPASLGSTDARHQLVPRSSGGSPPGRRGGPRRGAVRPERRRAGRRRTAADRPHRPEHGREVDGAATGRAHRAARPDRQLRPRATSARIGLCDRIFTRVGAADDIARGQSTFMVEMAETATILHHATRRSLVILDEIGRGTSTYDGLAIAWAVAEDLAQRVRCRAMFATHYHELCDLAEQTDGVANQCIGVHESGERIVFLRTLKDGGASRSYGIQCARLAGLPPAVVERARAMLLRLERHAPKNAKEQLSLFGSARPDATPVAPPPDPIRDLLRAVDPDTLSPRQAADLLYQLKTLV